jgi:hypothetical protein
MRENPKYIQEYLREKQTWSDKWTKEEKDEYIKTAEFGIVNKMEMFHEMRPGAWEAIWYGIAASILAIAALVAIF